MKHIKKFNEGVIEDHPSIGNRYSCKRDYLDLFVSGMVYEIYQVEDNLGDIMYYLSNLSDANRRITGWGLKEYELGIYFNQI